MALVWLTLWQLLGNCQPRGLRMFQSLTGVLAFSRFHFLYLWDDQALNTMQKKFPGSFLGLAVHQRPHWEHPWCWENQVDQYTIPSQTLNQMDLGDTLSSSCIKINKQIKSHTPFQKNKWDEKGDGKFLQLKHKRILKQKYFKFFLKLLQRGKKNSSEYL